MENCANARQRGTTFAGLALISLKRLLERFPHHCFFVLFFSCVCSNLTQEASLEVSNNFFCISHLSQICPLCASPIRGRHSFLEKVIDHQFTSWVPEGWLWLGMDLYLGEDSCSNNENRPSKIFSDSLFCQLLTTKLSECLTFLMKRFIRSLTCLILSKVGSPQGQRTFYRSALWCCFPEIQPLRMDSSICHILYSWGP